MTILATIAVWIAIIICIEAVTEIIVGSELFDGLRDWIGRRAYPEEEVTPTLRHKIFGFFNKLIQCGYCTSVWVAGIFAWTLPEITGYLYIDIAVKIFVAHRLSNWFHEFIKRWLDRHPFSFVIHRVGGEKDDSKQE